MTNRLLACISQASPLLCNKQPHTQMAEPNKSWFLTVLKVYWPFSKLGSLSLFYLAVLPPCALHHSDMSSPNPHNNPTRNYS